MPQDWFSANAPAAGGSDWFAANAPKSPSAAVRLAGVPRPRTTEVTRLDPEEEPAYEQWLQASGIADADAPGSFYDYRGLFRATKGATVPPSSDRHFPDTFKQHGHQTFSRESQYSAGPGDGGVWKGEQYLPPGSDIDGPARKGFTLAGVGSGLKDIGVGAFDFARNVVQAMPTAPGGPNLESVRALVGGAIDQVKGDVSGIRREPSMVAKIARGAAVPLDVLGIPATSIAEEIIQGDYGRAAGLGLGAGAMVKGPQAALRLRGARVAAPADVRAPLPVRESAAAVPARIARAPGARVSEPSPTVDLGPEFAAVDAALTGEAPAARARPNVGDAVVDRAPEQVTPEETLYREARDHARTNGYDGTDAQLRTEFDRRLSQARSLLDEVNSEHSQENMPRALLQAIADGGGLSLRDKVFGGELSALSEMSQSLSVGRGVSGKTGRLKASHTMPRMELGGVGSVLRNDGTGLSLDGMVEYLGQDPRFKPHIESINDLLEAIDGSARASADAKSPARLADALQASGVRPDAAWWTDEGAISARGTSMPERAGLGEPPADWFTQNASDAAGQGPRLTGDTPDLGGNAGEVPPGVPPGGGGEGAGGFGGGDIPAQRPLSASSVADERFIAKLPADLQPALRQVWQDHAGFEDQRRGVQPLARTQALADQTTLPESMPAGTALNAEGVTSAYDALIAKEREYGQLAPKVAEGTATDTEWLRHRELETERVLAAERVRGAVAESGRSMRAIRAKVEELRALQIAQQSGDPAIMAETRAAVARGTMRTYFRNYVYGNLVSGVATQERNFMGNALMLVNDIAADVATGKPGHAGAMLVGALNGLPRGLKEFAHVMRHGGNAEAGPGKVPIAREMPGGMLNPWNDALRMLSATDRLFRAVSNRAEMTRRAWTEAGTGPHRSERAARLLAEHPEWHAEAETISTNRLFQDREGKATNAFTALRDAIPGGFLVAPFVRISANLAKMGATMSPLPYAMHLANRMGGDFQFGRALTAPGRVGELARARAAYGSMMLAALTPYALSGNVTGDGPKDPGRRALWLQTHQPNSIRVGKRWVSLQTWPGVGLVLQALANGVETARELQESGQEVDGVALAANVLARTVNSITSQSFLHGVEDFQNAIADPARYASRAVSNLAGTVQPLVGMQRTIAQILDPTVRAPQGLRETFKANTPGLSRQVPPLLDPFGEPVTRGQSPLTVGVVKTMKPSKDPLTLQLEADRASMPRPTGRIDINGDGISEKLTRQEETELAQARGRETKQVLEKLILGPDGHPSRWWLSLPVPERLERIREAKAGATRRVNDGAKGELLNRAELFKRALLQQLGEASK